ncbi:hypothetical protein GDO78_013380 [Eleutherodactylus coqui]|uniref:Fibronectin type-III domain-containing protein n=2 Tax=Eleutherodactylus coqui TaxID=57060 RepID=A0A8J6EYX2_ELECQ|nr:hypothetical protein GDO78_013380 [Eleutherodactylus coqui]
MRTYLKGPCTEEKEVWSEWVEMNYPAPLQGTPESKVKDFKCINEKYETLKCEWKAGELGSRSNYELQFWQAEMSQKKTCTNYITLNEINIGCDFRREKFEFFSDLFICVSGTPGTDPIQPSYFIFQLQNIGKPGIPENLTMTRGTSDDIVVEWTKPMGRLPAHCMEYEIQSKNRMNTWQTVAMREENKYSFNTSKLCVRVRGRASMYCANDGYWSEWSTEVCWSEPSFRLPWLYCVVAVIMAGLCVAVCMYTVKKKRQWSKKLQYKAKELVYDIDPGHNPKC